MGMIYCSILANGLPSNFIGIQAILVVISVRKRVPSSAQ